MSLVPYVHVDADLAGRGRGTEIVLDPDDLHHLTRVLRLGPGAAVVVADGSGGYADAVLADSGVRLRDDAVVAAPHVPHLVVVQAVPKGRKLDEVIRHVVELGADRVIPVHAHRSVVQRDAARAGRAGQRWSAIARAAAEQSRRPWRSVIDPVATLDDATAALSADGVALLVADPGAPPLPVVLAELRPSPNAIAVAIGPEGGWSDEERARLHEAGARQVGLGPTVLRTEHAAAAAVAVLGALLGRWM